MSLYKNAPRGATIHRNLLGVSTLLGRNILNIWMGAMFVVCAALLFAACAARSEADTDGDGRPDSADNCPDTPNANQTNADGDELGDACDPDAKRVLGNICDFGSQCVGGICFNSTCSVSNFDSACSSGSDCTGDFCVNGKCTDGNAPSACNADTDCRTFCIRGVCSNGSLGNGCNNVFGCTTGLVCYNGTCTICDNDTCDSGDLGSTCFDARPTQCTSNICVNNVCTDGEMGSACNSGTEDCDSGYCGRVCTDGSVGSKCSLNSDCANNQCIQKTCSDRSSSSLCKVNTDCTSNVCTRGRCN